MNRKLLNKELNRPTIDEYNHQEKYPIVFVLDNIRSLNNVGSVFRTADAFNVERLVLCGITARPPHRDIHKTALGATESVQWEYYYSTHLAIAALKQEGYTIVGIEQAEDKLMLQQFTPTSTQTKIAAVFGNEVFGIDQHIINQCELVVEIPQLGTKHSLNIAVSAGVVGWHLFDCYSSLQDQP